jgi:hypothetical protein
MFHTIWHGLFSLLLNSKYSLCITESYIAVSQQFLKNLWEPRYSYQRALKYRSKKYRSTNKTGHLKKGAARMRQQE